LGKGSRGDRRRHLYGRRREGYHYEKTGTETGSKRRAEGMPLGEALGR